MQFESRQLLPYAEPVSRAELMEGEIYFVIQYLDDEMLNPTMAPAVFIGENLAGDDVARVYFQDVGSYRRGIRHDSATSEDEAEFDCYPVTHTGHVGAVFMYERAIDELLRCSLRRMKHDSK